TSQPEKGSTFWFTAELRHAATPLEKQNPPLASFEGQHALIVDDNATNLTVMVHLCVAWNLRHRTASSVKQALVELRQAAEDGIPFDLVVTDHHMPDRDGLDLAKAINEEHALRRPALVLLTSRGEKLPHAQLESHRFAACELKPIHAKSLRETLGRVLANAQPAAPVEASAAAAPASRLSEVARTLVAEDNPVNQKVTLLQLRNLGYAADLVCNGREAMAAVQKKDYALVLMDAQMPDIDGVEATRRIREAQAAGNPSFPSNLTIVA